MDIKKFDDLTARLLALVADNLEAGWKVSTESDYAQSKDGSHTLTEYRLVIALPVEEDS